MVGKSGASTSLEPQVSRRHDKFYMTDEMAVFQVCDHHMLPQSVG